MSTDVTTIRLESDSEFLYWTSWTGRLQKTDKKDGRTISLAEDQCSPYSIGLDESHVFWLTLGFSSPSRPSCTGKAQVWSVSKSGGTPALMDSVRVEELAIRDWKPQLAVDDGRVSWIAPGKSIRIVSIIGGQVEIVDGAADAVAARDGILYWSASERGQIVARERGGATRAIVENAEVGGALTTTRSGVLWWDSSEDPAIRETDQSGQTKTRSRVVGPISFLFSDDNDTFWIDGTAYLVKLKATGGTSALSFPRIRGMKVEPEFVYLVLNLVIDESVSFGILRLTR